MHDYMKALYHRFDSTTEQIERLEEETDRIYKKLVKQLGETTETLTASTGGFGKCTTGSGLLE